jgi:hypothetical protein
MKKMKKILILILNLIALLVFGNACKDNSDIVANNGSILFPTISSSDENNLLSTLDKPNLVGLVTIQSLYQDEFIFDFDGEGNYTPYTGTTDDLSALITNSNRTELVSLSPASLVVNAFQMIEASDGNYYVPSHLEVENYFGSGYNKIVIDSNQYFDKLVDSVTFSNAVRITNVSVGQVISRNQDLVINFTGATNNSFVELNVDRVYRFEQIDTNSSHTISNICHIKENTGQVILPIEMLEEMKTGYYTLTVSTYEPKYVTLSNGKEILMLGLSEHRTTIQIED